MSGTTLLSTREVRELGSLREELNYLLEITTECRIDMHAPDEQGLTATVTGRCFDNAGIPGEKMLHLRRGSEEFSINLATLIALARQATL